MSAIRINSDSGDMNKIINCIKNVVENVSNSDIAEIVLNTPVENQTVLRNGFLLEGRPRSEYEECCIMFDHFITGLAVEGREIAELTEKYQKFYQVMKEMKLRTKESNRLEEALYGVAIEAEMQGFIYGFKLFDALLNKWLSIAM